MAVADRELIRAINRFNIINTIRQAESISRVEISDITGQSRGTVTNITADLLKENLIFENKSEDSLVRGRKRVMLTLNPDAVKVVGVKVSDFQISFAAVDMKADILNSLIIPVRTNEKSLEFIAGLIEEGVHHCISQARLKLSDIAGIGIGIPGFVDASTGICYWSALSQKGEVSLKALVQRWSSVPTFLENDANTVTMAEQWFGEGRGVDNFLVVTVEHGIGMGIVVNGQIYRGDRGIAAEFGHMVLRPGGNLCRCGKKGCIEAYASDISILQIVQNACRRGECRCGDPESLTIEDVTRAALQGETLFRKIFHEAGEVLGLGLSGLIQIFNPARIIICGEGLRAGELLIGPLQETVRAHTNAEMMNCTQIIVQNWKDTDWARGAAVLVLQELFKRPQT